MILKEKIEVVRTKRGYPALWERGGGCRNTGHSIIIAGPKGQRKKPVYFRERGHANDAHALFIVGVGDLVLDTERRRSDILINVYKIVDIDDDNEATLLLVNSFSYGEWDDEEYAQLITAAANAAAEKASCYHCREPHYADIAAI